MRTLSIPEESSGTSVFDSLIVHATEKVDQKSVYFLKKPLSVEFYKITRKTVGFLFL